ncbi:MAG TPA: hypothetical protein PLW44_15805, partial [Chitinophagales bacterium]|nr:hypothetical protein [Chitinophagales bacterium]
MGKLLPYYLPVYLVLYMAVAFVIPTYRTWKATGINPITFGNADTAHNYVGFVMKLLIALLFIAVLLNATGHEKYLAPLTYLQ